jgi:hypothetical protein
VDAEWDISGGVRSPEERKAAESHLMAGMRAASTSIRFGWALLFAVLLSLRLIGSAGYMPAIDHGSVTIVVCPDADLNAPLAVGAMHHHAPMRHSHNPCPYAAASALGAVGNDWTPLIAGVVFAVALLLGTTFLFVDRRSTRGRPPAIGPPIAA